FEVLKFMDDNYRTSPFAVIAGIDFMANYSNFYLMKENPLFRGYINLSPDLTPLMPDRIQNKASKIEQKIWYYLATGEDDIPALKKEIDKLDELLSEVDNPNFSYDFDSFDKASHFSLVASAIPNALNTIFKAYRPISDKEYQNQLLDSKTPVEYLEDKYFQISELYAIDIPIRINDFLLVADAIEENENWDAYKDLSRLAKKESPKTVLSTYFEGRYYQEIGKPKKAIKAYQGGYGLKSAGYLNSDTLLEKADELKRIFGY
ncbi:MAG: esterase, partial [Psychroflexus sp.]